MLSNGWRSAICKQGVWEDAANCSASPTLLAATAASLAAGFGVLVFDVFVIPEVWLPMRLGEVPAVVLWACAK